MFLPVGSSLVSVLGLLANDVAVRKQIQHMVKYRYVPFSFGKAKYTKNSN